ncbi:acetolactate synthase [Tanacetum coccineum]
MAVVTPSNHRLPPPYSTVPPPLSPISTTPKRHRTLHITTNPRKGSDVLVEALEREGVTDVFAYPGGASMKIHQSLTQSHIIRNVLPRHKQGGVFVAEGYARTSGKPDVCIATSGPGATNLVPGLADALLDSVPLIAITGQVPRMMIGTDVGFRVGSEIATPIDKSDLFLVFGVRFDDRVTGKLEAFASRAKIVHIDIDSAEIRKNKQPHVSICGVIKIALQGLNKILEKGVGKGFDFSSSRQWLTSGGLGAIGFGLPTGIGAAVARPDAVVVDIDGDGSFMMNVQELATIRVENLSVKILLLNNQHMGMVVQWDDRFYKANRANTYLGNPMKESEIFPYMLKFAEACNIPAARVTKKADLRAAIQKMLDTLGPYLLYVIVPHQEHVLPMIPTGGGFMDVITKGDGGTQY